MAADAYQVAIRLQARREHAMAELRTKLTARDFISDEVTNALERLRDEGYQSDQRYAETYIRVRVAKGYGPNYIRQALQQQEIDKDVIHYCLYEQVNADFWADSLCKIWQKHFKAKAPEGRTEWIKQFNYFVKRGFEVDQIKCFLNQDLSKYA